MIPSRCSGLAATFDKNQFSAHTVIRLKNLDISYIYQLRKLFSNLFQNHGITTAYNCHSGITFICSHADCQAVNIITSDG